MSDQDASRPREAKNSGFGVASFVISIIAVLLIAQAPEAHADWQYTRWGMTPQQVIDASGGQAVKNDNVSGDSTDDAQGLLRAYYIMGTYKFVAVFLFDRSSGVLTMVQLKLKNLETEAGYDLHAFLWGKYGAPLDQLDLSDIAATTWRDERNYNHVAWLRNGDTFKVQYKPLALTTSEEL
jgi:hypothetical protein